MRLSLVIAALLPVILFGQDQPQSDARRLAEVLLSRGATTGLCFDDSAVAVSSRLGVTYDGVLHKCMISFDIEDSIKSQLKNKVLEYTASLASCGEDYQRLTIVVPKRSLSRDFYFRRGCLTSPFFCLTNGWWSSSSRFFRFAFADSDLTNPYAIESLDRFVLQVGEMLEFTVDDFTILETQKVLYYLCRNETEIEHLTGFRTRGMYNLAYDAIVTTYNAHLHELVHFLVNFKLKRVRLFAHPFLQEGLAVALGGRGGLSADVVVQLGTYLLESGMIQYPSLLRRTEFSSVDASLSYPVAGMYTRFLLHTMGAERFLALYERHCGLPGDTSLEAIPTSELPALADWQSFQRKSSTEHVISFPERSPDGPALWLSDKSMVAERHDRYHFSIQGCLLFGPCDTSHSWHSNKFSELFPGHQYPGHRYAALADSQTVSIYDLWTNTLIAGYIASFEISPRTVPSEEGKYMFTVPKSLFSGRVAEETCRPTEIVVQ